MSPWGDILMNQQHARCRRLTPPSPAVHHRSKTGPSSLRPSERTQRATRGTEARGWLHGNMDRTLAPVADVQGFGSRSPRKRRL